MQHRPFQAGLQVSRRVNEGRQSDRQTKVMHRDDPRRSQDDQRLRHNHANGQYRKKDHMAVELPRVPRERGSNADCLTDQTQADQYPPVQIFQAGAKERDGRKNKSRDTDKYQ
ncbi:hypothetical protein [uncultured Roseobacter sp.]|uniref:hypothetical protein n=1 Tax=uncultured Roseobacter sp. TaxID=114847 RepID=UPI00262E8424|nr:hypothetical protein [uncultured Roseobacter sp.]